MNKNTFSKYLIDISRDRVIKKFYKFNFIIPMPLCIFFSNVDDKLRFKQNTAFINYFTITNFSTFYLYKKK